MCVCARVCGKMDAKRVGDRRQGGHSHRSGILIRAIRNFHHQLSFITNSDLNKVNNFEWCATSDGQQSDIDQMAFFSFIVLCGSMRLINAPRKIRRECFFASRRILRPTMVACQVIDLPVCFSFRMETRKQMRTQRKCRRHSQWEMHGKKFWWKCKKKKKKIENRRHIEFCNWTSTRCSCCALAAAFATSNV